MRGMEFTQDRPGSDLPLVIQPINHRARPARRARRSDLTPPKAKRDNDRRSSSDKTGQATRARQRALMIKLYGPICHICLANGITDREALIDLEIPWPQEMCFTRDHLIPRSKGGADTIDNLRPAHHVCNRNRANGPVIIADAMVDEHLERKAA